MIERIAPDSGVKFAGLRWDNAPFGRSDGLALNRIRIAPSSLTQEQK